MRWTVLPVSRRRTGIAAGSEGRRVSGRRHRQVRPGRRSQGCQMVYFHTKNANFGKFLKVVGWKMLVYFVAIW
jgi:hypothetical protein